MKELTGRHVLFILLGAFGVVFAVNGCMAYVALSTFNGSKARAYSQGLRYNERIAAATAQAALHWSHKVELSEAGIVKVSFNNEAGSPVAGLNLKGEIGRPASNRFTSQLTFTENKPGVYTASPGVQEAGSWVVALAARRTHASDAQPVYRIKERLWLKPKQ
jgi:nitrogen fixation protein FixH